MAAARGGKADNLQQISGIGPKLEKTLHGLGFFHFSQIADWNSDEVMWVDEHLRFKGRIERDKWISQAKVLAKGK
jgi:NADH-quinone oxidoreductase subunit E